MCCSSDADLYRVSAQNWQLRQSANAMGLNTYKEFRKPCYETRLLLLVLLHELQLAYLTCSVGFASGERAGQLRF